MRCLNCGWTNQQLSKYCGKCGARLGLLQHGDTLRNGDYVIDKILAKGGMGAIYLANEVQPLQRPCVIKEMIDYFDPTKQSEREKANERFKREAQTLALLSHPSIPKIYTFFSERGHNYIVMEFIDGEDLEERITHLSKTGNLIKGKPLSTDIAIEYIIQIARVLEYLSNIKPEPVVHQDIKPANIIIAKNTGQAMLVDFGTARAKFVSQAGGQVGIMKSSIYGTEGYAPPEQYKGESEPKSDVYALAATLYHLLTDDDPRNHPFNFPNLVNLPKEIQCVLSKALEHNINKRPTAKEFREELENISKNKVNAHLFKPFIFRITKDTANDIPELIALIDSKYENWESAKEHLYGGDFNKWLIDLGRTDLLSEARIITRKQSDKNIGLEEFLEKAGAEPPKIKPIQKINLGKIDQRILKKVDLHIENAGRGWLSGKVELFNFSANLPQSSVGLTSSYFSGNYNTISVIIDTPSLIPGITYQLNVKITSNGGTISVPIAFTVSFIWSKLFNPIVKSIKSTAIMFLFVRALLFVSAYIFGANNFDGFSKFGVPFWSFFVLFFSIFRRSGKIGCLGLPITLTLGAFINPFIIIPIDSGLLSILFGEILDIKRLKYEYYYYDVTYIIKILVGWTALGMLIGIIWGIPNGLKDIRWIKNKDIANKICFVLTIALMVAIIISGKI